VWSGPAALSLGGSKGEEGMGLWGDAAIARGRRGHRRDSTARLCGWFFRPYSCSSCSECQKLQGKNLLRGSPSFCWRRAKTPSPFLLCVAFSCVQPHPLAARIIPERQPKTFGSITAPLQLNEQLS